MKYLKLALLVFFLISFHDAKSQLLNKTEREYFILGTLRDYMGRMLDPRDTAVMDEYDATDEAVLNIADSLLKIDYPRAVYKVIHYPRTNGITGGGKIVSKVLSEKFNSYYNFSQSGSGTSEGEPILSGELKTDVFNTDKEKLAFLAGVFVRYGTEHKGKFQLSVANSRSKLQTCVRLLNDFFVKSDYQIFRNNFPVGQIVYFRPAGKLASYLRRFMPLQRKVRKNWNLFLNEIISGGKKRRPKQ